MTQLNSNRVQYLTKEKLEELKKELDNLKNVKRKKIAEELEFARSLGDLSENAEYHQARSAQADMEDRIYELEDILKTAVVISSNKRDMVSVGSEIVIKKAGGQDTKTYFLVSSQEADVTKNKISDVSPLGQAMVGKKAGEEFKVKTPQGEMMCHIISVK